MSIEIVHQVGHFSNWNIDSFQEDKCGDGLILSPVHQSKTQIQGMVSATKQRSLFDPQFYLPNSPKKRLASYSFFPDQISDGFSTADFALVAVESAKQCVEFQLAQDFKGTVIPSRFIDQMKSQYFESQEEYSVLPFLKALTAAGGGKPVYLTVPVTSAMVMDEGFRLKLLNWITGFPEISGVYVLVNDDRKTKQISSEEFLFSYLHFAHELKTAGLHVVLGHLNTESILFSMLDDVTVTFGSFENTRMFSLDKFIENDEERRAPRARVYMPALLNWVQYGQAMQVRSDDPKLWEQVYTATSYSEKVIGAKTEPYFNQPDLYKHHFLCLEKQLRELAVLPVLQRYEAIKTLIKSAQGFHQQIAEMPLELDAHGNGAHLAAWLGGLNRYYRKYLKK